MFVDFFLSLKKANVPVTLREYLTLMEGMEKGVADYNVNDFYFLSRACLVKDERNLDKFDRVFGICFKGLERFAEESLLDKIPEDWLRKIAEQVMSPEEMVEIEALGGLGTTGRSKFGTSASSKIWTQMWRSASATSRWRFAASAILPARAPPKNWICPAPSIRRPATPASWI